MGGEKRRKPVIGLAGGIGAGKSEAARILADLGAGVIDSDALAREELNAPDVIKAIRDAWGDEVLTPDGKVDRVRLRRIFAHPTERQRLESLIHPRVARRRERLQESFEADPSIRAVVLDSPLLFEAGLDKTCDVVLFIEADRATRQKRVEQTRLWSDAELEKREKLQKALDLKKRSADYIVENNSTVEKLSRQLADFFSQLITDH